MRWLMGWSAWQFISFMISKKKVTFPESGIVLGTICIHTASQRERDFNGHRRRTWNCYEKGVSHEPLEIVNHAKWMLIVAPVEPFIIENIIRCQNAPHTEGVRRMLNGEEIQLYFWFFFTLEPRLRFSSKRKKRSKFCKKIKMNSKHCAQMHATRSTRLKYGQIITLFRAQYWTINQNGGSLRLGASVLSDHEPKNKKLNIWQQVRDRGPDWVRPPPASPRGVAQFEVPWLGAGSTSFVNWF